MDDKIYDKIDGKVIYDFAINNYCLYHNLHLSADGSNFTTLLLEGGKHNEFQAYWEWFLNNPETVFESDDVGSRFTAKMRWKSFEEYLSDVCEGDE